MTDLGHRLKAGELDAANPEVAGAFAVAFTPKDFSIPDPFEIWHISLKGPGGYFYVYIDDKFYSTAPRGDINEYDPQHPMRIRPGETVYFYWRKTTGLVPKVWVYCRTLSVPTS